MAADNVQANAGTGGSIFRTFSDGTNEWCASVVSYVTGGSAGAWTLQAVDATHGLPVAVVGAVAVTGTFWPATQPVSTGQLPGALGQLTAAGSLGVVLASDQGAVPVSGAFWQATQPVSAAALPLPAGASTAAKQPAPGTAGAASADVLTVQGVASMTPLAVSGSGTFTVSGTVTANLGTLGGAALDATLTGGTQKTKLVDSGGTNVVAVSAAGAVKVDGSAVTQPVSGTFWQATQPVSVAATLTTSDLADGSVTGGTAGTKSILAGGQYNASPPTLTAAQQAALQLDASGNLKVNVTAGGASGGTSSNFGAAFPATGTAVGFKDSAGTNLAAGNLDASGNLKVNVAAGGASGGTSSSFAAADPATGTAAGYSDGTNMREARVFDADTGAGTQYVLGALLKKPASGGSVDFGTGTDPVRTDPTGTTTQPVSGTFWQATQPVSGTFWQTTQPVSGTVTANLGTLNGAALDASVTALQVSQASTTSGQKGGLALGAVTTAAPTYTTAQTNPLSLTTAGALRVDASATTQPVSGTFWQATQPVSGTVTANAGTGTLAVNQSQWAGTAVDTNSGVKSAGTLRVVIATDQPALTNALKVDGSAVTQPVSGTFWQATQPVSGTVAATQSGTWTVQPGNTANTTAWKVDGSAVTQPVSGTVTANIGTTANDRATTAQTLSMASTANAVALACPGTGSGNIQVTGATWTGTLIFEATVDGTNWFSIPAAAVGTGALVTTTTANGQWSIGSAGFAQVRVRCSVTGTNSATVSIECSPGCDMVTLGNPLPAGANTIGAVTQASGPWTVQPQAGTAGGATPGRYLAAAAANQDSVSIKGSAGTLYMMLVINVNAAVRYVKLYDKATGPVSTDTPVQTYGIPGNTAGAGVAVPIPATGLAFANGIGMRLTTGQADSDATAVTAADLAISYGYK